MLNGSKAPNALNMAMVAELNEALRLIDADKEIDTFFTTESEMAFAGHPGGAGIKELKNRSCE